MKQVTKHVETSKFQHWRVEKMNQAAKHVEVVEFLRRRRFNSFFVGGTWKPPAHFHKKTTRRLLGQDAAMMGAAPRCDGTGKADTTSSFRRCPPFGPFLGRQGSPCGGQLLTSTQ